MYGPEGQHAAREAYMKQRMRMKYKAIHELLLLYVQGSSRKIDLR